MSAPTEEELQILPKFRSRLDDLKLEGFLATDLGLLQWLRARDLHLGNAEEMLRKSLKWREENPIDLTWKPPTELTSICSHELFGYDKDNSPVCHIPFGAWNLSALHKLGQRDNYMKYVTTIYESMKESMKGRFVTGSPDLPVSQFTFLVDTERLSFRTLTCLGAIDMIMESLRILEGNFPETLKCVFVMNASKVFTTLFNLVKPILSKRTFGKIQIHGRDRDKWMPVLLNHMPEEILPYYFDHIVVTVGPGKKFPVDFKVTKPDSILSWSFITEDYDMGFSLSYKKKELVPYVKVDSHMERQEGSVIYEKPGTYTFLFDNSYSRLRGKY